MTRHYHIQYQSITDVSCRASRILWDIAETKHNLNSVDGLRAFLDEATAKHRKRHPYGDYSLLHWRELTPPDVGETIA
jgi:hypothetical protein